MNQNAVTLSFAVTIIKTLQQHGIDPVLYGSLGVSLYLGTFKTFGDVDLLVRPNWLHEDWDTLQQVIADMGFTLADAREHEFKNDAGVSIAFAEDTVLTRDRVVPSLDAVISMTIEGCAVRTLAPQHFKEAYLFSEKDGYRKNTRGKKDAEVIRLLDDYLSSGVSEGSGDSGIPTPNI